MGTPEEDWPEALATVTRCVYDMRAGRALAFGLPSGKHFRIAYSYWVQGEVHTGEYFSEKPLEQGSLFTLRYNSALPGQNTRGALQVSARTSLLALGVAGSVLLSLAWFLVLKGCR